MNLFNENMTLDEARYVLYSSIDNKSEAEIKEIYNEYDEIIPVIFKNQMKVLEGWMTSF